jgi:uncharacterized repeat protein (TIGR01451 family)
MRTSTLTLAPDRSRRLAIVRALFVVAALAIVIAANPAHAAGTTSGTTISNTATLNFSVGGFAQTAQNSNASTFVVDRKINLTVAQATAADVAVVPGATSQVIAFTVTNTSNATLDFALSAANKTGGTGPNGGTDNFDASNLRVFVDANNNGVYDPATDLATFVDELPADSSKTVFVVVDIPAGRANGDLAAVTLTATASESGSSGSLGATVVQTTAADTPGSVDTVFADGAGDTDSSRDGKFSAAGAYKVVTATVAVTKTSAVVSDPFNNTTNPKAIPGALVRYTLTVTNSGSVTATSVVLTDAIPTNTTYVAGSITFNGAARTDASDGDNASFAGNTVTVNIGSVANGATATVTFDVTVN